jgi:ABC-type glutathione transport system ATPase component
VAAPGDEALFRLDSFGVRTTSGWRSRTVTATVRSGECLVLHGRFGSGKTLILEQLCGILRPAVESVGTSSAQRIELVPQDARLAVLPTDNVWSLVGMRGWRVRAQQLIGQRFPLSAEEERAVALMKALRLDPVRLVELPFRELSVTERRSILLVRALLRNPLVTVLDGWDEQTDAPTRRATADLLRQKMLEGMALILSSRQLPLRDIDATQIIPLEEPSPPGEGAVPLLKKPTERAPHEHALLQVNRLELDKPRLGFLKRRAPAQVLDGTSLFVRHGETLAVLGIGGSGKTALFHAISGLERATRGTIFVENHDVTEARGRRARRLRRDVQLVFQDSASILDGYRTVQEHLEEALSLRRTPAGTPAEWLERLGLWPRLLRAPADQLSAAESQRVDLARSLILAPKLVLFDAPEVSAAGSDGGIIAALLQSEKASGRSFLVGTADPELAYNLGDRVAILHAGRVLELGTRQEVLDHPSHPLTQALLSGHRLPLFDPTAPTAGCPYVLECSRRQLPECQQTEPMLAPIHGSADGGDQETGQRRVACFHPIIP